MRRDAADQASVRAARFLAALAMAAIGACGSLVRYAA
jgi:hypothetical protein